jgi:hypothetical protein
MKTAVNAKVQRRKDTEKMDFSYAAKIRLVHCGGDPRGEKT